MIEPTRRSMWTSPTRPDVGTASGARASNGRLDICLCDVASLEEERKARGLGESVRKTVAKIQGGGVTALTELPEGLAGDRTASRSGCGGRAQASSRNAWLSRPACLQDGV